MKAREYLSQTYHLDVRINSKIEQLESLNELAAKCTAAITGMPRNPSPSQSTMADAIGKILDLQAEINHDIDDLVNLKCEIVSVIKRVENLEYQTLLEKRYLCFFTWEEISATLNYDIRWTYRMHNKALDVIQSILDEEIAPYSETSQ